MKHEFLSLNNARKIILKSMMLDGTTDFPGGKEGISHILNHLGYVQIDTIAVVERAHHHVIASRAADYKPAMLDEMLAEDRTVFEYWGHAASYLPMNDYRFYLPRMKTFADPHGKWEKERLEKYGSLMAPVLERIRSEGALGSADFELPDKKKKDGWWDWHGVKTALELLYWRGDLMVSGRRKFEKLYDLTERVLPAYVDTRYPSDEELGCFLVERALQAMAIASEKEIANYIIPPDKKTVGRAITNMLEAGAIIKISIEGVSNNEYYMFPEALGNNDEHLFARRVFILSPFDNFIIQRQRIIKLWNFDYTLECYTPAAKRKFGYFAMPILWGDKLVGKIDAKADRKMKKFIIRKTGVEPWFAPDDEFRSAFNTALDRLADFNGCNSVVIEG